MSRLAPIATIALLLSACVVVEGDQQSITETLEFDDAVGSIDYDVGAGNMTIVRGDVDHSIIERTVSWRGDAPRVIADLAGDHLTLGIDCDTLWSCSVDHVITLPASADISGKTGSGDVWIDGMDAHGVDVETGSGNVNVANIAGPVNIGTGSGDLDVECVGGDATLSAGSGNIHAHCVSGDLQAETGSGDILIATVQGNLSLQTSSGNVRGDELAAATTLATSGSGDIELQFWDAPSLVDVSTGSGNADLWVPAGTYSLDLQTGSGNTTVTGIADDPRADGQITVSTGSGNIHLIGE